MGDINNQFSLTIAFRKKVTETEPALKAQNIINNFWVSSIMFIFEYAPFISGLGAISYGISSILSADLFSILVNRNIMVLFNILIGVCGFITICEWLALNFLLDMLLSFSKVLSGTI
jgi:hypothetical protein